MNRRHFLMSTAVVAGNAALSGFQSPNETVRVGIAGLGGRGVGLGPGRGPQGPRFTANGSRLLGVQ